MLNIGVLVNPVAGIGGAVGLKGSDGADIQAEARRRGGLPRGAERLRSLFASAPELATQLRWFSAGGEMGASVLAAIGVAAECVHEPGTPPSPEDTQAVARILRERGVDLLLFFGGDGTARDILDAVQDSVPVLGVPSGVKMHSGVFATSPRAAAEVLQRLVAGGLVAARLADVRDVDEQALRDGRTGSRFYGELRVPELTGFVQHTKVSGREDEGLAVEEVVQGAVSEFDGCTAPLVFGPGGTLLAVKQAFGGNGTLLGFDVRMADGSWLLDVTGQTLETLTHAKLLLGFGGGQGILIGRGNQQLTPAFLRTLNPLQDVRILATRSKIASLEGRPLLLDTGDAALDGAWAGLWEVLVGYDDRLFYQVTHA